MRNVWGLKAKGMYPAFTVLDPGASFQSPNPTLLSGSILTSQLQSSQSEHFHCQHPKKRSRTPAPDWVTVRTNHHRLEPAPLPDSYHVLHNHPPPLAPAQTLPIRSHLLSLHADSHREIHLQYGCPTKTILLLPSLPCPFPYCQH